MNFTRSDIEALERAGDALMRAQAEQNAVEMYALALKLRAALNEWDETDAQAKRRKAIGRSIL